MRNRTYWKAYVHEADADEIERNIKLTSFTSGGKDFELVCFEKGKNPPNILVAPGSGAHAYVYAELGYFMHLKEYNVFIMPKHGSDHTIEELMKRCNDAVKFISSSFSDKVG